MRWSIPFAASLMLALSSISAPAWAAPTSATSSFWQESITRRGASAFGPAGHKIFRNVRDYGAIGDGSHDDTDAINRAIADGPERCGGGEIKCDSRTTTPVIVYFPAGTYAVSRPLNQYYYTQMIGDANNRPTIKATPDFVGMAVIDADPYLNNGTNWFTNQNNFFRQVRNFVIDLRSMPPDRGAGIHWQVAQATSLQDITFEMHRGGDTKQLGIFMDNGSGGYMSDLVFNGGKYGAFLGSQQFTSRNLEFNDCDTAIFMNWNWGWTFQDVTVNNCRIGIDMSNGDKEQTVGSLILLDSSISATTGIKTAFSSNSSPNTGGTLIIENTDFSKSKSAVEHLSGEVIVPGGSKVGSFVQGRTYTGSDGQRGRLTGPVVQKPAGLLAENGHIFTRSKPQYQNVHVSKFVSVKTAGAKGDGKTDDTAAINAALRNLKEDQILFFDHGAYVVKDTIKVPSKAKIVGEFWPLIMATGEKFSNPSELRPVVKVGEAGETGSVEMSDLMLETMGPAPGATLLQWNLNGAAGANGMWDVHARVGGSAGTQLQSDRCSKKPSQANAVDPQCVGAGLLFHTTKSASVYTENCWFWVADHELDRSDYNQIDIFNGRGVLIESQNPVWLVGTASEHNVLYNYQLNNAKNVWMGLIQSETPYYQGNPSAPKPFTKAIMNDPQFPAGSFQYGSGSAVDPNTPNNLKSWGLRLIKSSDVYVYGAGLYSFFENYDQECVKNNNCQKNMISIEEPGQNVFLFGINTKAAVDMIEYRSGSASGSVKDADNRNNFCAGIARWTIS